MHAYCWNRNNRNFALNFALITPSSPIVLRVRVAILDSGKRRDNRLLVFVVVVVGERKVAGRFAVGSGDDRSRRCRRRLLVPRLLNDGAHLLLVFAAILAIQLRGFVVCRRIRVRVVQQRLSGGSCVEVRGRAYTSVAGLAIQLWREQFKKEF